MSISPGIKYNEYLPLSRAKSVLPFFPSLDTVSFHYTDNDGLKSPAAILDFFVDCLKLLAQSHSNLRLLEFGSRFSHQTYAAVLSGAPARRRQLLELLGKFTTLQEIFIPVGPAADLNSLFAELPAVKRYMCDVPRYDTNFQIDPDHLKSNPKAVIAWPFGPKTAVNHPFATDGSFRLNSIWLSPTEVMIGHHRISRLTALHLVCCSPVESTVATIEDAFRSGGATACNISCPGDGSYSVTPFHVAIGNNYVGCVRLLLEKFKPDLAARCFHSLFPDGLDALELAIALHLCDVAELLLDLRPAYYAKISSEQVYKLFLIMQHTEKLRPSHAVRYYSRNIAADGNGIPRTFQLLILRFGKEFPVHNLRDEQGRNLLHRSIDPTATNLLIESGVSSTQLDSHNKAPWMIALDIRCRGRNDSLVVLLEAPAQALETFSEHLPHFLMALALLRYNSSATMSDELLKAEERAWDLAPRELLEKMFFQICEAMSADHQVDFVSSVAGFMGAEYPFRRNLKGKQVRFQKRHQMLLDTWLCNIWKEYHPGRTGRLDEIEAATIGIASTRFHEPDTPHIPLRADAVARIVRLASKIRRPHAEEDAVLGLLEELVELAGRDKCFHALRLACLELPERYFEYSERFMGIAAKLVNMEASLAGSDADLTPVLRLMVR